MYSAQPMTIQRPRVRKPASSIFPAVWTFKHVTLLTLMHVPLGILFYNSGVLAMLHAYGLFAVGMFWALDRRKSLEQVGWVVMYIAGTEVIWRMAQAPIFWEFGKYGSMAIMVVALARRGFSRIPPLPALYLVLLVPSCLITLMENDLSEARTHLSFNMSGPIALAAACCFFSYLRVTPVQLKRLILCAAIPVTSVGVTTLFYTVTANEIQFGTESNFATSGGFGPNQVSAMLGCGVFLCALCYFTLRNTRFETIYFFALMVFFAIQSVLTFSRGGMYSALGAILVVVFFRFRRPGSGVGKLLPTIGLGIVFVFLIFPYLNDFTGGNLQTRFEEVDTTRRLDIVDSDMQIFMEHPLVGIGVGQATGYRARYLDYTAPSHTEFSRIIAEHGSLGILGLVILLLSGVANLTRGRQWIQPAVAGGLIAWSSLFMLNSGMRLAAPSILFGASFLTIVAARSRNRERRGSAVPAYDQFRSRSTVVN